jgi:hypothetical protein
VSPADETAVEGCSPWLAGAAPEPSHAASRPAAHSAPSTGAIAIRIDHTASDHLSNAQASRLMWRSIKIVFRRNSEGFLNVSSELPAGDRPVDDPAGS